MKFEKKDWKIAGLLIALAVIGYGCYVLGTGQSADNSAGCLTTADLNRTDIETAIVLSRFCEGIGLQSSVYWQQDEQGQKYGMPICVQIKE